MLGRDHAEYKCWTLLSAIAGFTNEIDVRSLVLCNDYRNPARVAQMAATLDVISSGRLQLGLGAGWHEPENHVERVREIIIRKRKATLWLVLSTVH